MSTRSWWGADLLDHGATDAVWARARGQVTYGRLRGEVDRLAATMGSHGIGAYNTVALQGVHSFTMLWSILALWSIGAQVVLLGPRLHPADRAALLEVCSPQFLLTYGRPRSAAGVFVDECEVLARWLPGGRPARSGHCVVQLSSGTTGLPKLVGRTSESLIVELDRLRTLPGMPESGERIAVLEPVTRSFGLVCGLLYTADIGATAEFPTTQTARGIGEVAAHADVLLGNPRHFELLTEADGDLALPQPRLAVSGGEPLPPTVAEGFRRRYGLPVGQAYGTTETGIVAADLMGRYGTPTIGPPVAGVRTRITDGVLEVHVPHSPYLYQDEPWLGGWMSTHDLVTQDPATGALRLRGRVEESGHARLDLLAIESVLRAHDQVTEAVVLGVDPIEAHVASEVGLEQLDLTAWCRRFLDEEATPVRYHVFRELPRTANGKVLRNHAQLHRYLSTHHATIAIPGEG